MQQVDSALAKLWGEICSVKSGIAQKSELVEVGSAVSILAFCLCLYVSHVSSDYQE